MKNLRCRVQDTGCSIKGIGHRIERIGYRAQGIAYMVWRTWFKVSYIGYGLQGTGY